MINERMPHMLQLMEMGYSVRIRPLLDRYEIILSRDSKYEVFTVTYDLLDAMSKDRMLALDTFLGELTGEI